MLAQLSFNFNNEFVKYLVIFATTPLWLPFLKAMWEDFNDALRDEGGLLGYAPPSSKLQSMDAEQGRYESVLVSEPWERPNRSLSAGGGRAPASAAAARPAGRAGRPGFGTGAADSPARPRGRAGPPLRGGGGPKRGF